MGNAPRGTRNRVKAALRRHDNRAPEYLEEPVDDRLALEKLTDESLREELHAVVDRVMDTQSNDAVDRSTLKARLHQELEQAVDGSVSTEALKDKIADGMQAGWSAVHGSAETVDDALDKLKSVLHNAFEGARPGAQRGALFVIQQIPKLVQVVSRLLPKLINDEKKVNAFQKEAVELLTKYMSPKLAARIVDTSIALTRAAVGQRQNTDKDEQAP